MLNVSVSAAKTDDLGAKITRGARRGMRDAADAGFAVSQEEVPVDRATLLQSGAPPEWVGDTLVWGYRADHARHVEEGTAPHYPPIEPLLGWARRVLDDESAAYAIQETIGKEGTAPQPFVEPGVEEMVSVLERNGLSAYIDNEL